MARPPRFILPGQPQHVIHRGNNRQQVFIDGEDYRLFLNVLATASARHRCDIHAYVLMTNHVHLLVTPLEESGIGDMIQRLGSTYVQPFNRRHGRTGTLWEGRYRAGPIDSETYLLTCMRYIDLNPVRAGIVGHPRDYPWSSYRFNALGEEDEIVRSHPIYRRLGKTAESRQSGYRQLCERQLPEQSLEQIRTAVNKSWALGDDRFLAKMAAQLGRPVRPTPRGGDRKSKTYKIQRV